MITKGKYPGLRRTPLVVALGSVMFAVDLAAAQLEEIFVTAQRRDQSLQDVPISVSVMPGEVMEEMNLTSLHDVTARMPNVSVNSNPLTDFMTIRGVGSGQNAGFEQAVGTFVDGFYRGRSRASKAAMFDIEQIEVLKGPQTTFFGNNTSAGALNITTRKPSQEMEGEVRAVYGEYGQHQLDAAVSVPVSDTLAIRLAGRVGGQDGYSYSRTTDSDFPDIEESVARLSLLWEPSDSFSSHLRFDKGSLDVENFSTPELINCPPPAPIVPSEGCGMFLGFSQGQVESKVNYEGDGNYSFMDYEFEEIGWTNRFHFDNMTLVSSTGYFSHDLEARVNILPTPVPGTPNPWAFQFGNPWGAPNPDPTRQGYLGAPSPIFENAEQFSQELRLVSTSDGPLEWMVGAYYAEIDYELESDFGFWFLPFMAIAADVVNGLNAGGAGLPPITEDPWSPVTGLNNTRNKDETLSAFASVGYSFSERLRANAGIRYTQVKKSADRTRTFGESVDGDMSTYREYDAYHSMWLSRILGSDLSPHADPTREDSDVMPSFNIQYDLGESTMVYGSYTRGFKAGGYSAAAAPESFEPETVDAYELGMKGSYLDGSLQVNMALFRSEYADLQETVIEFVGGSVSSVVRNAAESIAEGVELGLTYQASPELMLFADVAYLSSEYDNYESGTCTTLQLFLAAGAGCAQDMSGKQRPYAPEYSGSIGAEWSRQLGAGELVVRPLIYFTDDFFHSASADPLLSQKGYVKYDLAVSYRLEDWTFSVIGKNLSDKTTLGFSNAAAFGGGSAQAFPDPPRWFSGRVVYRF